MGTLFTSLLQHPKKGWKAEWGNNFKTLAASNRKYINDAFMIG
jgi:hypothetical protein